MSQIVTSQQFVKASPAQAYFALTHSIQLHDWLCDFASVQPRPGGRMYLYWHGNFFSAGEYLELEENKRVKFSWFSRIDPAPSEVTVTLAEQKDGTLVTLVHSVPDGDDWKQRAAGFKENWDSTLPNLAHMLETGLDKRTYDRPMLGIQISDFNSEIAKRMGVPVGEGQRLDSPLETMGAYKAGLRKDDVIVGFNGKPITNDFGTLVTALQGKKGGDSVEVVLYRGPEKKTVAMELSKRPIPDIPSEPVELATQVRAKYDEAFSALEKTLAGVSEKDADFKPAPGEWSAKETLAHLIHTARNSVGNLDDAVGGFERLSDDFGGNIDTHVRATVAAYKTTAGLVDELKRLVDEAVIFIAGLPPEFVARRSSYMTAGNAAINGDPGHILSHVEQIRAALQAAKK